MGKHGVGAVLGGLVVLTLASCNGQNNNAASDLLNAFQSGCSLNGTSLQLALSQTQSLASTIQDLQTKNTCAGVNGALGAINNLSSQISSVSNNQVASQVSSLAGMQKLLLLQINATKDPVTLATLTSTYSENLLNMGEAQSYMVTANGATTQTPLQSGSAQVGGYVSQLLSDQTNLLQCAQDDPGILAQMSAGMLAVAGSFTAPVTGLALSFAGNILSDIFAFIHDSAVFSELDKLNQIQMSTALPCGLEQMTDVYCQAQDLMEITHLQECAYNPGDPSCPAPGPTPSPGGRHTVSTEQFWQGLDVLTREMPALQIWISQVVTGTRPSNPSVGQGMNAAADAVSMMDDVLRLAQGVMNDEASKIANLKLKSDQDKELRNGLAILQAVLAADSINPLCVQGGGFINCNTTPVLQAEGSAIQLLYDLVSRDPNADKCTPSAQNSGGCQNASSIPLTGLGTSDIEIWQGIEGNAGGIPVPAGSAGKALIDTTLARELALELQQLNTDPSDLLEKVNVPAGEGLPSPIKALSEISEFLATSHDYFSDKTQVPDSLLDGGAAMRPGILGLLEDSSAMVKNVTASLGKMNGHDYLGTLNAIYDTLQLHKDRNFLYNRLLDQIHLDIHTRISSGEVPSDIYEILSQGSVDPTVGLTQIPPESMETTLAALGQAQSTSQLNVQEFAQFFAKSLDGVIVLLKNQADMNREGMSANPRVAPNRAAQARVCLLLATSQNKWPSDIDPAHCAGISYLSELTGQKLAFNDYYAQLVSGANRSPQRMCEFYRFYRASENFVHEKQNQNNSHP